MTKPVIEFFFDVGSPASYLAWTQVEALAARHDAEIVYQPMLLGAVFQMTGNVSPAAIPEKGRYIAIDFKRFAQRYAVPFVLNPSFPINTMPLMRGALAYLNTDRFAAYLECVFKAMWVDGLNMGDPQVIADVLGSAGFSADEFLSHINQSAIKDELKQRTEQAVARGVFGAPTFFVGEAMFFGQDRLEFVEQALIQGR